MQCVSVFTRILPACAGVNPYYRLLNLLVANSPRMRGGQPDLVIDAYATFGFSPACAGVNPTKTVFLIPLQRHSPRMRGGQPGFGRLRRSGCLFCFFASRRLHTRSFHVTGFQTCALPICQPCAAPSLACHLRFIPHARGSTRQLRTKAIADVILPARAGVNPP